MYLSDNCRSENLPALLGIDSKMSRQGTPLLRAMQVLYPGRWNFTQACKEIDQMPKSMRRKVAENR